MTGTLFCENFYRYLPSGGGRHLASVGTTTSTTANIIGGRDAADAAAASAVGATLSVYLEIHGRLLGQALLLPGLAAPPHPLRDR